MWVRLQDEEPVVDAMSRIREGYPNALHVEHPTRVEASSLEGLAGDLEAQSEEEVFEEKWAAATDRKARADEEAEDVEEPDVEGAEEKGESLEEELDEVKETVTMLEKDVEEAQDALQAIEEIEGELQEASATVREELLGGSPEGKMRAE